MLHQNPSSGLYSSSSGHHAFPPANVNSWQDKSGGSSRAESTGRGAEERESPVTRRARSVFNSPRPAGTGRCLSRLQQDLPGVNSASVFSVSTELGGETVLAAKAAAESTRSKDPGWKLLYLPAGSIASGGLLPLPMDSHRSQTVFAPISSPHPVMLSSAGCQ
jgi:hypothetical protein